MRSGSGPPACAGSSTRSRARRRSSDSVQAGTLLSEKPQRLLASDIIWSDLFKAEAEQELKSRNVTGVGGVPKSVFVGSPDLYVAKSLTLVWQRVHGASTGGTPSGVHGTNIEYVKVEPEARSSARRRRRCTSRPSSPSSSA